MKAVFVSSIAFILLNLTMTAFAEETGAVQLSLLEGDVRIYSQETAEWRQAAINMPVNPGDRISVTGDGRAELHLQGGVYARLGDDTTFDMIDVSDKDAHFYLDRGHIYINNKRGGIRTVQIDTPSATCNSADNSLILVDVDESGDAALSVVKGYAYLENRQGKTRVASGKTLRITAENAELSPIAPPDGWERWNFRQDRAAFTLGESARYLPDELHEYANDFDDHGRWVFVRDYGYAWTPAVIGFDWVPFRLGQWIWSRGDYVWVSDERWGWAPYHYGRWAFVNGVGWCWVPPAAGAAVWGPGYVAWTRTPGAIGWLPLAPGEIYYGRRQYGPGSVSITTVTINHVKQVYKNVSVNNAVTMVPADTFNRGERPKTFIRENPFTRAGDAAPALPPPRVKTVRKPVATSAAIPVARLEQPRQLPVRQLNEPKAVVRKKPRPPQAGKPGLHGEREDRGKH